MNDLRQRMDAPGLNFKHGGEVDLAAFERYDLGNEPLSRDALIKKLGGGMKGYFRLVKLIHQGGWASAVSDGKVNKNTLFYPPEPTILGDTGTTVPSLTPGLRPDGGVPLPTGGAGAGPNQGPRGGGRRGGRGGGRRGRNGGGGRGGGGGEPPPPRIIPPGRPPGGGLVPPGVDPVDYTPPDRRAGRDTEYSKALQEHQLRVAASLAVPPGGFAGGGQVNYYDEGGAVRPGHGEDATKGPNPYEVGSASYNYWERRFHAAPPPPPEPEPEEEEVPWYKKIMGYGTPDRTAEELEEMEQAYGGYIDGYANGGLASASGFAGPPRGGVPPQMRGAPPRRGGVPPRRMPPRGMPPGGGGMPPMPPGKGPRRMVPPSMPPGGMPPMGGDPRAMPPRAFPNPGMPPQGGGGYDGSGIMGGPPRGGMDPRSMPPIQDPRSMPPQGGGGAMTQLRDRMQTAEGQFSGRDPRAMPPVGGGRSGMLSQMQNQARQFQKPRGYDPRGGPIAPPPGKGPGGAPGGPMVPPNFRGQMQRQRMMNRPRRGVPGPAGAGGSPNRVGMQDQQGALARAMQKGTGRRPMSRRSGFPGR